MVEAATPEIPTDEFLADADTPGAAIPVTPGADTPGEGLAVPEAGTPVALVLVNRRLADGAATPEAACPAEAAGPEKFIP